MAKSAFGSYSSVPTTGGLGQGAAQVFAPQAIATDMTQFGKGLSTAAAGAAQVISDVKDQRAEIEQKIKEQEKLEKGEYDYTNGLIESTNSDLDALVDPNSEYRNKRGKVRLGSIKDINKEIDGIIEKRNNIKQYESAWRGVYDSAPDNDKFWNSQSNSWESTKDYAKNKLLNPPSQEEIDALKSGDLGVIVRKQLFDFDNGVKYDPNYNLEQKVQEQMKTYNPGTDEQSRKDYDLLTSEEKVTKAKSFRGDELENFKKSLGSDIKLKRERAERYAVDNGMPKSEVDNIMNDETFNATWTEEVGKAVDANQRTSTSGSISPLAKSAAESGENGTGKAVIPMQIVTEIAQNSTKTGLNQIDAVAVAPFTIEGVGTIYRVGLDKNGNKIGYDAGGNVIADKNTFKSIEQKMLQGKSKSEVDNYNESIGKLVKGSTEIPYDQETINSATGILEEPNPNIIADELKKLGIDVGKNHLEEIVVPSMENGIIAAKDVDGNFVYLPIGYKGKSNEEIIAMLTDPEGDYKADEKTVTTFEKEMTGGSKLQTAVLAAISLPVGVGFGISQYLTGSGYKVNTEDIAKILIGDIVTDNPLPFVGKGDLGKLKDPEALDIYLKRNEINLPIEKRDIAISNINDGMSIKEAVEASGGTAKKDTNPTRGQAPKFNISGQPIPTGKDLSTPETPPQILTDTKRSGDMLKLEEAGVPEATASVIAKVESATPKGKNLTTPETAPQIFTKENGDILKISKPATVALNTFKGLGESLGINVPEGDMESDIATMFDNLIGEGNRNSFWDNGKKAAGGDPVPSWCAAFVGNLILQNSPEELTIGKTDKFDRVRAKKYADLGTETTMDNAEIGNIVVLKAPEGYHVGIYAGLNNAGDPIVFGGNQVDSLSVVPFPKSYVTNVRKLKVNTLTKEQVEELSKFIDKDLLVEGTKVI
jgi:hypothetical protein